MLQEREQHHVIDILFVMALLALFAFSGVMLIALGASVYRGNVDAMDSNYTLRTSYAYVSEKVRRADTSSSVSYGTFHGEDALLLREDINGISYVTRLYAHEGKLMELLAKEDADLPLSAGNAILDIGEFDIEDAGGMIAITLTETDGKERTLFLSMRSGPSTGTGDGSFENGGD